jgi:hypothetical protein
MEYSGLVMAVKTDSPLSCRKVGITATTWMSWTDIIY